MVPLRSERAVKLSHRAQPTRRKRKLTRARCWAILILIFIILNHPLPSFRQWATTLGRCRPYSQVQRNVAGNISTRVCALSELVTVSCFRFDIAAVCFCTMSVRGVIKERNNTHVLPMILSDPPHLRYHHSCRQAQRGRSASLAY
jgi:hypothetical protein